MSMRSVFVAFSLLFPLSAFAVPSWSQITGSGWTNVTNVKNAAGDIAIETRKIDGLACYRGKTSVTGVSRDKLYEVVADIPGTLKWSTAGVTKAEVLGKSGATLEYFQYLDVPGWTFANDRFWFLKGTTEKTADSIVFRWERLENGGAYSAKFTKVKTENPSAVEPPINVGGWSFAGAEPVLVTYSICSDTGGAIPAGIQKAATRGTLPDTIRDAVVEAKKRTNK